jgi:hypothetical protein
MEAVSHTGHLPRVPGQSGAKGRDRLSSSEAALTKDSREYRKMVGRYYDLSAAMQFNLLSSLGLREHHYLLDIGCGSLRGGRLFIPYLLPGRYFGIEPEEWLINDGIENEIGQDLVRLKSPTFRVVSDFSMSAFGRDFDFLLAQSVFSHAAAWQIRLCLAEVRKVMQPNALFAASYFEGDKNYLGDEWVHFAEYTFDFITSVVDEQQLACQRLVWAHPSGQTWLMIFDPARTTELPQLPAEVEAAALQAALGACRQRLRRLETHPWVRLGQKGRALLRLRRLEE